MSAEMGFTSAHVSAIAARAAELERIGEELLDPHALVRAARLYTLAVRIADDMDERESLPFMKSDLARVRDELRQLATDAAASGMLGDRGLDSRRVFDATGDITRMFREVAARIEQRLAQNEARPR
jgi:hypothetical protein